MKTLLSTCALSAVLLTSACTPKDAPVTDAKTRGDIQAQNAKKASRGGGSQKGGATTDRPIKVGGYQAAAFLMEKQIEAIEMVRLSLGVDDGTKGGVKVSTEKGADDSTQVTLTLGYPELLYTTDKGNFKSLLIKNVIGTLKGSGDVWNVALKNKEALVQKVDSQSKKDIFLNYYENNYSVTAESASAEQATVDIIIQAEGSMNGRAAGTVYKENFKFKVTTKVDKASLMTEEVKIVSMSGELTTVNADKNAVDPKPMTNTIEGQGQVLKAQGKCNQLLGSAKITSDKSGRETAIAYKEDRIAIGTTFYNVTRADCGLRPTFDLSLLLPF